MLLTGTYERAVDDKLRVAIPKRIRELLGGDQIQTVVVAPGTDGSLGIYTEAAFTAMGQRLAQESPTQEHVRAYSRLFYGRAQQIEIDGQGRIRLPTELARLAGIEKDAVLVGVQDHLELWEKSRWEAYLASQTPRYDALAEAAFSSPRPPASTS